MSKEKKFYKISELDNKDRTKLKGYWSELWGNEFAKALVTDYEPSGDMKKVKANKSSKMMKKKAQYDDLPGMGGVSAPSPSGDESSRAEAVYRSILDNFQSTVEPIVGKALSSLDSVYKDLPSVKDFSVGGESDRSALADQLSSDLSNIISRIITNSSQQLLTSKETQINV